MKWFIISAGQQSEADCIPCTPGSYCETTGLSVPTALCDEGWYCVRAAVSPRPYDIGNTSYIDANVTSNCFCAIDETGGMCQPGQYCPRGSSQPLDCYGGKKFGLHLLESIRSLVSDYGTSRRCDIKVNAKSNLI